jgi:hypothetical protein
VTAATALVLSRMFASSADFWLNIQQRNGLWEVMNSPHERARVDRAKPSAMAAQSRIDTCRKTGRISGACGAMMSALREETRTRENRPGNCIWRFFERLAHYLSLNRSGTRGTHVGTMIPYADGSAFSSR